MKSLRQYMISRAFRSGLFDACVTIGEVKRHGNLGLGEYEALDGEIIGYNGDFFRITADGKLRQANDDEPLCFAQVADVNFDRYVTVPNKLSLATLASFLEPLQGTRNAFFAFTIVGHFDSVAVTVYPRQSKPYVPLSAVQPTAAACAISNVRGRLVGFYSPAFSRDVGVPGYHCHFINEAKSTGGHVTAFTVAEGSAAICQLAGYELITPTDADYLQANLDTA